MACRELTHKAYQIICLPTRETKKVGKVKGVRLNYKTSQQDVIKKLLLNLIDK